jgi:hypothetical protein
MKSKFIAARRNFMKTTTERSMFRSVASFWRSFDYPSVLPLKRAMDIREPSFDETGAQNAFFRSVFLCIEISQWTSPQDVHPTNHDMRQRQLTELVFLILKGTAAGRGTWNREQRGGF